MTNEHQDWEREAFEAEYASGDPWSDAISLARREDGEYYQALARMCFKWFCKGNKSRTFDFVGALKEAKATVSTSPLFKKFIDGTPLQNDIAVWMTEFAGKYARARLDKAAVEPVPVDAGEWIVEAYPVHDANEAKQFLADTVDATENFSGTMYWVRDSENRAVAITGCGAKGKQNAERIASLPARRGVSEEAGKCEVLDQQAVSDALATYNESYGNGVDKGQCIRRAIRKYLDTLGLDAEGRPYALKQRLGGKSEDQ